MNYVIYFYEVAGIAIFGIASVIVASVVFAALSFLLGFLFKPRNIIKEKEIEKVIESTSSKNNDENEEELVAVITSAICTFTGREARSFRIKSIKERKAITPIWAMAARLNSKFNNRKF